MSASSYDLCIQRNANFNLTIQLKDSNGLPIDLTDAFVYSEIKQDYYLPVLGVMGGTIVNEPSGIVSFAMNPEQTANLHPGTLKYDVLVRYSDNSIQKVLRGNVEVETNVTSLGVL